MNTTQETEYGTTERSLSHILLKDDNSSSRGRYQCRFEQGPTHSFFVKYDDISRSSYAFIVEELYKSCNVAKNHPEKMARMNSTVVHIIYFYWMEDYSPIQLFLIFPLSTRFMANYSLEYIQTIFILCKLRVIKIGSDCWYVVLK